MDKFLPFKNRIAKAPTDRNEIDWLNKNAIWYLFFINALPIFTTYILCTMYIILCVSFLNFPCHTAHWIFHHVLILCISETFDFQVHDCLILKKHATTKQLLETPTICVCVKNATDYVHFMHRISDGYFLALYFGLYDYVSIA